MDYKAGNVIVIENNEGVISAIHIKNLYNDHASSDFNRRDVISRWPIGLITKVFYDSCGDLRVLEKGAKAEEKYSGLWRDWIPHLKARHATDREKFLFLLGGEVPFLLEEK